MGIIADDLTGATDSSGHFVRKGFSTIVFLDPHVPLTADVIVINTDSRADDARTARKKVKKAVRSLLGRTIYKKIDSSLRGNIGVELKEIKKEISKAVNLKNESGKLAKKSKVRDPYKIKGDIDRIEVKLETEAMSFEKEKELSKKLRQLKNLLRESSSLLGILDKRVAGG